MRRAAVVFALGTAVAPAASAQNWSFDARAIALGGTTGTDNIASAMIADEEPYGTFVVPLGLLQVASNVHTLNPSHDDFDLVRAFEFAASPLHYVVGRDTTTGSGGSDFVVDLSNGTLNRDLNAYRGFVPANQPSGGGVIAPSFGATIPVLHTAAGTRHGVYVGAGPYLTLRGSMQTDDALTRILGSDDANVYVRNARLSMDGGAQFQGAAALSLGYRGQRPWPGPGATSARDGLYLALNYHYLIGLSYTDLVSNVRLDTDSAGLLTLNPLLPSPLTIDRNVSKSGRGHAVDIGVAAVAGPWELGLGANNVANVITWTGMRAHRYALDSLLTGGDLVERGSTPSADLAVHVPVDYRASLGYHAGPLFLATAIGKGFNGPWWHGGVERRLRTLALRGGAFYSRERWHPSGGIGFRLTDTAAFDVAVYGSTANIERNMLPTIAMSFRLSRANGRERPRTPPVVHPVDPAP